MRAPVLIGFLWLHLACSSDSTPNDQSGGVGGATSSGGSGAAGSASGGTASGATGGSAQGATGGAGGSAAGGAGATGGSVGGGGSEAGSAGQAPQGGAGASGTGGAGGSAGVGGSGGTSGNGTGGSSAGSAGTGTSGGGAGGTGGALGSGCGASAIFCEDFEALTDGPAQKTSKWTPMGNTLTLDATHARGQRALHIKTQASGDAYIQLASFSAPSNSFFGRIYLWATAFPSKPDYAHYTLVEGAGSGNGSLVRFIGGQYIPGNNALWGVGSDGGPTGDWTSWKASAPAEAGKWLCMEWEAVAATSTIRVWINGTAKTDLTVSANMHPNSGTFTFPTFNKMSIGWWLYQENATPNSYDFWIDDIAFSPTRVGCD